MVLKMSRNLILLVVGGVALVLGINFLQSNSFDERDLGTKATASPPEKNNGNSTSESDNLGVRRNSQGLQGVVMKQRVGAAPVTVHVNETILRMIREIRDKIMFVNATVRQIDISCGQKSIDDTEDLLCMDPPKMDPKYKNPCWSNHGHLQCLPYFQVIGMDKCGSTDLFDRIIQHPYVIKNGGTFGKETMWWSWLRYGHWLKRRANKKTFKNYLDYFRSIANKLQKEPKRNFITGDGTPMDLWDNTGWRSIPQNNGLREPKYITPHLIKHINPHVKLLIILRDPIERIFSDYFFLQLGKMTIDGFHDEVVRSIKLLHTCTRTMSLRACLYSRNLHLASNARIALGFYSTFLQDWFHVFPRQQFLILRTEDFANSTLDLMYKVFRFLDLGELPPDKMHSIATSKRKYVTKKKKMVGKMKPETREILEELYGDFNQQLAALLNDRKFTWK